MLSNKTLTKLIAKFVLLPLGAIIIVTAIGGLLVRSYIQSTIEDRRHITSPNGIEVLEKVIIGGIDQWQLWRILHQQGRA